MPRAKRQCPGGVAYHVMNRAVAGAVLFEDDQDYAAFERVLREALERFPRMRLYAYCLMPNHFHLVLWPGLDGLLSLFMQWLTMTHTQRWHAHRHSAGRGHLYQGRFKSFPIERDDHFLTVCRYVERNALRAGLTSGGGGRAEDWRWGSLAGRSIGRRDGVACCDWPVDRPRHWAALVNRSETQAELEALRRCARRGTPFGTETWSLKIAGAMGLESTTRPRGRPRKAEGTHEKSS